jgi:hypothetical protein
MADGEGQEERVDELPAVEGSEVASHDGVRGSYANSWKLGVDQPPKIFACARTIHLFSQADEELGDDDQGSSTNECYTCGGKGHWAREVCNVALKVAEQAPRQRSLRHLSR